MSIFVYLVGTLLLMTGAFAIPLAFYLQEHTSARDLGEQLTAAQDHAVTLDAQLDAVRACNLRLVDVNAGLRAELDALSIGRPLPRRQPVPPDWARQLVQIRELPTTPEVDS